MRSTDWPSTSKAPMPGGGPPAVPHPAWSFRLGRVGYLEACALQQGLVAARLAGEIPDTFVFLEHPPVITLGRAAHAEHLVAPEAVLARRGVEVFETTRGGD